MATRTRQGFEDLGREHGRNGDVRRYKSTDASWQARAYSTGFDLGVADGFEAANKAAKQRPRDPGKSIVADQMLRQTLKKFPKPLEVTQVWFDELHTLPNSQIKTTGINIEQMDANTKGWPRGAKEHALILAKQANTEANPKRLQRLYRALGRLQVRHGNAA